MGTLTNRQKQAIQSRLHISNAALELFRNNDYDSIKITDICKAAGVSVGAFYHYFKSKDDIIKITYQELDRLVVEKITDTSYNDYLEPIIDINYQGGLIMEEMGSSFVISAYQLMLRDSNPATTDYNRSSYKLLEKYIDLALEHGELKSEASVKEIADYLMMIARGVMLDWCLYQGSYSIADKLVIHIRNAIILINCENEEFHL